MRPRSEHSSVADGWRGARIGAASRERVRKLASRVPAQIDLGDPPMPFVVAAFLAVSAFLTLVTFSRFGFTPGSGELARAGGSGVSAVATGEWWKLLVANLLHVSFSHIAFNAVVIYVVGRQLEHLVGRWVLSTLVVWSAICCSLGAIWIEASGVAVGASGVGFGVMGCAFFIDPRAKTAAGVLARPLLVVSTVFTFLMPGISIGGHAGGFVGGGIVALACWNRRPTAEHPAGRPRKLAPAVMLTTGALAAVALAIGPRGDVPNPIATALDPLVARQVAANFRIGGRTPSSVNCAHGDGATWSCEIRGASETSSEGFATYVRDEPLPRLIEADRVP